MSLSLDNVVIDPRWALKIPANLALRRDVLPFAQVDGKVCVACANPSDANALAAVRRHLGAEIAVEAAEPASLRRAIRRLFPGGRGPSEGNVASTLCDRILYAAALRGASDVHLDPYREGLRVHFRVDGQLEPFEELGPEVQAELISRIKVLSDLDIAEKRAPQDGRFSQEFPALGRTVDIRTATLPTKYGERVTLRLLALETEELTLERLGMQPAQLDIFATTIEQPHGLLLLTGPTGSGKTTTLYAGIRRLRAARLLNVVTIEDPIEYDIDGVAQVEVDSADKVSFGRALRSVLRHDPDVVMIGEIRDLESADVAIKASLTGHLVLSTLHTNSALGVITRLVDMGVQPYLVGATLGLAVAQRLVRRLCDACRRARPCTEAEAAALRAEELVEETVFDAVGCKYCANRGYKGRLGLFEMFRPSPEARRAISRGAAEAELLAHRGATLRDDALAKLRAGLTSPSEVLSAVVAQE